MRCAPRRRDALTSVQGSRKVLRFDRFRRAASTPAQLPIAQMVAPPCEPLPPPSVAWKVGMWLRERPVRLFGAVALVTFGLTLLLKWTLVVYEARW